MSIFVSNNGDITLYNGDTGNIIFSGLPKDKAYTCYFSVNNDETGAILLEKTATEFNQNSGSARVTIDKNTSNNLPVGEWSYSFKMCYGGTENTMLPAIKLINGVVQPQTPSGFTVLDKRVEGE